MSDNEQSRLRRQKLANLRERNHVYPNAFRPSSSAAELHRRFGDCDAEELKLTDLSVALGGRIMNFRKMGKVTFADFRDSSGSIQLFVRQQAIGTEDYEKFQELDIGDIVGASGKVFRTRTGELSIAVDEYHLLTKALHPFPEKFHGLSDQELRYRQRYLDLIMNEDVRKTFRTRSAIVQCIRKFMDSRGFLEVETPMMHSIPGGAIAKPFVTHHNVLSLDMYLRIAPELFLKRLVVGGYDRVYEINRNFRNEGVSTQHNPEFTMLEFYQAYADYRDFMTLTEEMFEDITASVCDSAVVQYGDLEINLVPPFRRIPLHQAVLEHNSSLAADDLGNLKVLSDYLVGIGGEVNSVWGAGKVLFEIFERTVEDRLIEPTFITEYPVEVSPLSRVSDSDPEIADRFEFFVAGMEIANGFSELNDPEDQAERFRNQILHRESGDEEAMQFDEDYIRALEYGLPPSAGEGIGIDRLAMLLTNQKSIRDVILFPYLKPSGR
ncbi:MAG: lysine--tRNA ligase [Acidiferrobacterales bacterium]|nr:lysine--tRNA ligase [Acidiferrobacterales bacterium]